MGQLAQSMVLLMFISVVPIIGVAGYALRNRNKPGARGFLLCLIGMIGWSIMLIFVTWPSPVLPVHLNLGGRFFFQLIVAFGWALLVWEYIQRDSIRLSPFLIAVTMIVPAVTLALAVTNPAHHLVILPETPDNPVGISEFVLGPWYFVHVCFAILLVMLPVGLLLADFRGAHGQHRNQILLLLAGWVVGVPGALQTHLLRNIETIPLYVDLTPVTFLITSLLWGLALYRYQLFSLVPVSRQTIIETMSDPVVSVDSSGIVVDANPPAQQLLGTGGDIVGRPFDDICERFPALSTHQTGLQHQTELTFGTEDGERHFLLDVRQIKLGSLTNGSVLVFREVTELRERERELELLKEIFSRVFRHNIRNRLTTIDGYASVIENRDEANKYDEELTRIKKDSAQLLAHSEKATELSKLIDSASELEQFDLAELVGEYTQAIDADESATVTTDLEDGVLVQCHPLVGEAVGELFDNALRHHDRENIQLRVCIEANEKHGILWVEDDGPGIELGEIKPLNSRSETTLTHGSGVGLWLVDMAALKSGGSFSLTDSPELGGTRAELKFPLTT
ncbi:PAS domain-containing protein [Natronorubrum sp. JWXQ-INN-674]|uniref:histidine kinase n=1 Tax=Natronorubrum halalkaliphilum TaxID=2691917 RepID=A0A6B0VMK7_9EURY|nr:histidine kinase N-terminal 7TM domain-containing protein [Natronorubrum halalkaliphilum]MXV61992.1 PAS domain-containing protein [Natronorubrum halalkaliphilum]